MRWPVALLLSVVCCLADAPPVWQTASGAHDVVLANGVAVRMEARSAGAIYNDHAVLEEGAARLSHFVGYKVQAGVWMIEPETPNTQAVIRLDKNVVEVASLGGAVRVSDGGALLTRVTAGSRMAFQKTGASAAPKKGPSDTKVFVWVIVAISAAALAIGLTAAAQGKSI